MVKYKLIGAAIVLFMAGWGARSFFDNPAVKTARPANATIKITENNGNVYWTDAINFNETRSCVVFVAIPSGTHTVVCGNYRMEGLQGIQKT